MNFVSEERKHHTVYPPAEHVFTWTQMCDIRDVSETVARTYQSLTTKSVLLQILKPFRSSPDLS